MHKIIDTAFSCAPVRVIAVTDAPVVARDFEAWSVPEREILPIEVPQGRMNIGTGVVFAEDGSPVEVSRYLQKRAAITFPDQISPNSPAFDGVRPLVIFNAGWRNYYHTLIQGLFSAWIFQEYFDIPNRMFVHPDPVPQLRHLLQAFGLTRDNCVFVPKNLSIALNDSVLLPTTYDAYAYKPLKLLAGFGESLRSKLFEKRGIAGNSAKKVYISRRDANNRRMLNEEELEKMLHQKGYRIVRLSEHSLEEQAAVFHEADKIIAPHGAGLSNLIFARAGTEVLELAGSSYANPCFSKMGQVLDMPYSMMVCETVDTSRKHLQMTWRADIASVSDLA